MTEAKKPGKASVDWLRGYAEELKVATKNDIDAEEHSGDADTISGIADEIEAALPELSELEDNSSLRGDALGLLGAMDQSSEQSELTQTMTTMQVVKLALQVGTERILNLKRTLDKRTSERDYEERERNEEIKIVDALRVILFGGDYAGEILDKAQQIMGERDMWREDAEHQLEMRAFLVQENQRLQKEAASWRKSSADQRDEISALRKRIADLENNKPK